MKRLWKYYETIEKLSCLVFVVSLLMALTGGGLLASVLFAVFLVLMVLRIVADGKEGIKWREYKRPNIDSETLEKVFDAFQKYIYKEGYKLAGIFATVDDKNGILIIKAYEEEIGEGWTIATFDIKSWPLCLRITKSDSYFVDYLKDIVRDFSFSDELKDCLPNEGYYPRRKESKIEILIIADPDSKGVGK